jgi:hypothetical protein
VRQVLNAARIALESIIVGAVVVLSYAAIAVAVLWKPVLFIAAAVWLYRHW